MNAKHVNSPTGPLYALPDGREVFLHADGSTSVSDLPSAEPEAEGDAEVFEGFKIDTDVKRAIVAAWARYRSSQALRDAVELAVELALGSGERDAEMVKRGAIMAFHLQRSADEIAAKLLCGER